MVANPFSLPTRLPPNNPRGQAPATGLNPDIFNAHDPAILHAR